MAKKRTVSRHHRLARLICRDIGEPPGFPNNIVKVDDILHRAYHEVFSTLPSWEVKALLERIGNVVPTFPSRKQARAWRKLFGEGATGSRALCKFEHSPWNLDPFNEARLRPRYRMRCTVEQYLPWTVPFKRAA